MVQHAYLIIAHGYFKQLKFLSELLDHPNNTIFIMVDKKVEFSESDKQYIKRDMQHSKIIFIDRMNIYWGDYSIVAAMLNLFIEAYHDDEYTFFHLLSGQDLPLKNIHLINQFFEKYPDKNFITLVDDKIKIKNKIDERVKYYHFFARFSRQKSKIKRKVINLVNHINYHIQKALRIDRVKNLEIMYSSNWVSLNRETVKVIKNHQNWIAVHFKYTLCPDEIQGNLRYINWWQGDPYLWTDKDIDQLNLGRQNHLFSRKFDLEKYPELKEYIIKINKFKGE